MTKAKQKDMLELFSFELNEDMFLDEQIYYVELPESWREFIKSKRIKWDEFELSIKPKNLARKLQTLFPSIFYLHWFSSPWFIADEKMNLELLKEICLRWFEDDGKNKLSAEIYEETLVWQEATIKDFKNNEYVFDRGRFNWLSAFMARKFAREKRHLAIDDDFSGNLQFRHVKYNGKHECVSEPISAVGNDDGPYFSYVISFEFKHRGLKPERGVLNVKMNVRRYVQKKVMPYEIRYPNRGTILVGMESPFERDATVQSMVPLEFGAKGNRFYWEEGVDTLFADVLFERDPLKVEDIFLNPKSFITAEDVQALPVYSHNVFMNSSISQMESGLGLPERWALFELVKNTFPHLKQLDECELLLGSVPAKKYPLVHFYEEDTVLPLEVWSTMDLPKNLISYLKEYKKDGRTKQAIFVTEEENIFQIHAEPDVKLKIRVRDAEGYIHDLPEAENEKQAARQFERQLTSKLQRLDQERIEDITLSIVEIEEADTYASGRDPKKAIRNSFANTNRLTQFIHPKRTDKGSYGNRLLSSFSDLMTDAQFLPQRAEAIHLNRPLVSFAIISRGRNNHFPVLMKFIEGKLSCKLYQQDEWLSLPEALLHMNQLTAKDFLHVNTKDKTKRQRLRQSVKQFFLKGMREMLSDTDENIIVLVDANVRVWWSTFTNNNLVLNELPFAMSDETEKERVRVVRVNMTDEVPAYRINRGGNVGYNFASGLFKGVVGLYYSISGKPSSLRRVAAGASKYKAPHIYIAQQQIVEFIPLGCSSEEERDEIAKYVHKLRRLIIAYDQMTQAPYPLHLIGSFEKYLR